MGIRKRTTSTGETRYDVTLRRADRSRYMRTFRLKGDAEQWERDQLRARDNGDWIDPARARMAVSAWAQEWQQRPGRKPKTIAGSQQILDLYVLPTLGSKSLGSVTPLDIQHLLDRLRRDGRSAHTVRNTYRVTAAMFNAAVRGERIRRSPCRDIDQPALPTSTGRALEAEEVWALADAIDPRYRCIVLLGAYCGLRIGELAGLQVGDVDLLRRSITIERTVVDVSGEPTVCTPKTDAGARTLVLPKSMVGELAAHMARLELTAADTTAWLFGAPEGGPLRYRNFMGRSWRPAWRTAKIGRCTPHDLRRTNATAMAAAGVDPKTIQHRLGHADIRMSLGLYAKVRVPADTAAADAVEQALDRVTDGGHMEAPTGTDSDEG